MTTAQPLAVSESRARDTGSRLPRLRAVLVEQIRTTGLVLRVPVLIASALGVLATLVSAFQIVTGVVTFNLGAQPSVLPGLIGALLPIAVWAREDRFGPGFLWTLPVDRRRHALTKVMAGWVWLMGGVALFALCQLVLGLLSGSSLLPVETLQVVTTPVFGRGPVDPASLRTVTWAPGLAIWAVPFTAATATYLLASALIVGTRHPLRWVIGGILAFPLATMAAHMVSRVAGADWIENAPLRAVILFGKGRYGLDALLTMRTTFLDDRAILTTGEPIFFWSATPEVADWFIATLFWTAVGLVALWAAVSRHRERRRG